MTSRLGTGKWITLFYSVSHTGDTFLPVYDLNLGELCQKNRFHDTGNSIKNLELGPSSLAGVVDNDEEFIAGFIAIGEIKHYKRTIERTSYKCIIVTHLLVKKFHRCRRH